MVKSQSGKLSTKNHIDTLVIVKRYPSKDSLYEYTFVHARVKAYIKHGLNVNVFCLDKSVKNAGAYTFEGVKVVRGDKEALREFMKKKDVNTIATHLLTDEMWATIRSYAIEIPTYIWLHGSEIQDWTRRHVAYDTKEKRIASIKRYQAYYGFWRELFFETKFKTHFIFVSQYFADETMDDMDITIPSEKYSVIHNYINTDLFVYKEKPIDQRLKILSIRPFSSDIYGNDLTVAAVLELAKRPFFNELKFTIIGRGPLFHELTLPLKRYKNVILREDFLTQEGIAKEHRKNGVFLVPSRADTQGVSRDEAMSSGLVPVTNKIAAIPEFVGDDEGFLAQPDDPIALANAIESLYHQPKLFLQKSENSAQRVREQSGFEATVRKEIELLSNIETEKKKKKESAFLQHSTNREKILRDALFELMDEYNELKKEKWRKSHELIQIKRSDSYTIGRKVTAPLQKIRSKSKNLITSPKRIIDELAHPDSKEVVRDQKLIYGDLYRAPLTRSFYTDKLLKDITIASIMDDFTYNSFKYECNIVQLTPNRWLEQLKSSQPDMLFLESAWRGVDGLWTNTVARIPDELKGIIDYCNKHNIPTIFWNKEDPVHTVNFMKLASLVDFVFTTDADSIPVYTDVLRHNRVYLLPFAAQPAYNNPIEKFERKDMFNFAGSYYRRYKDRCKNFKEVVDATLRFRSLDIYDRNYNMNLSLNYQFPDEYKQYIRGNLAYSEIDKAYKGYRYAITMNTIKYSSTMFARRAFELLASNTITVGNYSKGLKKTLGELTISSDNKSEILRQLEEVASTEMNQNKYRLLGLRRVMQQHTYEERLERILSKVFTGYEKQSHIGKKVSVVCVVSSEVELAAFVKNYERQQYEDKQAFVVLKKRDLDTSKFTAKDVHFIDMEKSEAKGVVKMLDRPSYVAVFDINMTYGSFYLTDLVLATKYSQAEIIGKTAYLATKSGSHKLEMQNSDQQYRTDVDIKISRSLLDAMNIKKMSLGQLVDHIDSDKVYSNGTLAIDGFNVYNGNTLPDGLDIKEVEGVIDIDQGEDIDRLYDLADTISNNAHKSLKSKARKMLGLRKTYPAQKEI